MVVNEVSKTYAAPDHVRRTVYDEDLRAAAKQFLVDLFQGKRSCEMSQIIDAAMNIIENVSYYQPTEAQLKHTI